MELYELAIVMGIPTAVTGLLAWWLKRGIEKRENKLNERTKNIETLVLMVMQNSRANVILAEATARAVQRIPDAHCNGDMDSALQQAAKVQKEEKDFLLNHGIKHIFGE